MIRSIYVTCSFLSCLCALHTDLRIVCAETQLLLLGRYVSIADIISDITDIIAVIANCIGQ